MERHDMIMTHQEDDRTVFECPRPGCGRRLEIDRGTFKVLDQGDFFALHSGASVPDLVVSARGK